MSQAPCTLFWPRSGFTPTPGRPILPVSHGEVGDRHDRGRALAVLGDAEAVIDRAVAAAGEQPCRAADRLGRHAGQLADCLRAVLRLGDERRPVLELRPVAAFADEVFVEQTFGDDDMRQRPSPRRHWCRASAADGSRASTCARAHDVGAARIEHDQLGALAQPLLQPRGEHRMAVGRVGADDHDDVGVVDASRNPACRPRCRRWSSGRSRSANGRRARRYRHCCCRNLAAPASGRDRSPRWCSATR